MRGNSGKVKISLAVMSIITLANLAVTLPGRGQQKAQGDKAVIGSKMSERLKEKETRFPVTDYETDARTDANHVDPHQLAKRKSRNERHDNSMLGVKGGLNAEPESGNRIVLRNDWEVNTPRIPAALSDAVLVGEILDANAYISADKNGVYSEFTLRADEIIKPDPSVPAQPGALVTVEREGGRVRYPSGRVEWYGIALQSMPRVNGRYVLFLRRAGTDSYSILTGYELQNGYVSPLDGEASQFRFYEGTEEASFIRLVREACGAQGAVESPSGGGP